MARLRANNCGDATGASNPITLDASTGNITWASAPTNLPFVSGITDYVPVIVEPNTTNEEIIWVTSYLGSLTGTCLRGREGTSVIAHNAKSWIHGPTSLDASPNGLFGDGSDGTATMDGTTTVAGCTLSGGVYTLTRDVYFFNLTISSGVTLITAGFRVFVNGQLDLSGTIQWNGNNASGATGGAALVANSSITPGSAISIGAAGGNGSISTGGNGGSTPAGHYSGGSTGGTGGTGVSPGGSGGTASTPPATIGRPINPAVPGLFTSLNAFYGGATVCGGTGGGGGGGDGTNAGGGGGGGGGVVVVVAYSVVSSSGSGVIQANGGNGANGTGGTSGGGGGGGPGVVILIYAGSKPMGVSLKTLIGNRGLRAGSGTNGSNGNPSTAFGILEISA